MTAACAGVATATFDPWFSSDPDEQEWAKARCARCPIGEACLAGALERDEHAGIWNGLDLTPKPPTMATPDEPQGIPAVVYTLAAHGTRQRYQQGCHCGDCTKANTVGVAQHRDDHQYDPPKPDVPRAEPLSMFAEIPAVTSRRRVNA